MSSVPPQKGSVSPTIRNFKDLYHIKYQEKQMQNLQASSLLQPQMQQSVQQLGSTSPHSHHNSQYLQQQLHQSVSLNAGISANTPNPSLKEALHSGSSVSVQNNHLNPSSPSSSIKFPPFTSATQKQKLFLNNTNVLPKKVQQKAKMISLNLQNSSLSGANQNQSARINAESLNPAAVAAAAAISSMGHHHHSLSYGQSPFSTSVPLTRNPSNQVSQVISPSSSGIASPNFHSKNLSNQQLVSGTLSQTSSSSQLSQSQFQQQQQQQQPLYGTSRHRGHGGNYSSLLGNTSTKMSGSSPIAAFSSLVSHTNMIANPTEREQKRNEQSQLLEKYKNTPFLNYMFLDNSTSPSNSTSQMNFFKDPSHISASNLGYSQSATHSRNASTLLSQQQQLEKQFASPQAAAQLQQSQMLEKKKSLILENRSQIISSAAPAEHPKSDATINKNVFNYQYVIGKGGFGKVWRVENKKTKQPFAMKEMSKSKIITKRSVNSVMSERHLLSQLKHPFLVNMNYAFQDRDNLFLVMDLVSGGDLRFHIGRHRRFKEVQTKFFVACIVVGLEYLHGKNVIHRDIKPENLVLDTDGYVKVTDLGVARVWKPDNSQDTSGTPGYMAPEVMCRQNHGIAVDYFAVGVIAYEFMMGRRPYLGRNRKEIRDQILSKQVQIKKNEIPDGWSIEAADFINRMIQRKPINRLGANGPQEVKSHPWIKNFPWDKLLNRQLEAPFIPVAIEDNTEYRQQISQDGEETNEDLIQQNTILLRKNSVQNLFQGYNFDPNEEKKLQYLFNQAPSPLNNATESTHSTNNTNYPSDRSQSAINSRKTPTSFV